MQGAFPDLLIREPHIHDTTKQLMSARQPTQCRQAPGQVRRLASVVMTDAGFGRPLCHRFYLSTAHVGR